MNQVHDYLRAFIRRMLRGTTRRWVWIDRYEATAFPFAIALLVASTILAATHGDSGLAEFLIVFAVIYSLIRCWFLRT